VNTGAFDPLDELAAACAAAPNALLHVDGAFGPWAATTPSLRALLRGYERADSWATDAHNWLNVPYDCGIAFSAHPDTHRATVSARAAYLVYGADQRDAMDWTPESSRRARTFALYVRSLGSRGSAELVERCCAHARLFADGLRDLGAEVLNEVVLNQVLFRFAGDEQTDAVLRAVQESGEAWMSGTVWRGRRAIRISVSSWQTSEADVERTPAAYRQALGTPASAPR
jgi:glutamate/tyrosine decarboxylase-like PLP-dependent enzyme